MTESGTLEALEREIAELIVSALVLEDVSAADIDRNAPLFGTGLALDSVDALELAMALTRKFGVPFAADDARTREAFGSVAALAQFIQAETIKAEQDASK